MELFVLSGFFVDMHKVSSSHCFIYGVFEHYEQARKAREKLDERLNGQEFFRIDKVVLNKPTESYDEIVEN